MVVSELSNGIGDSKNTGSSEMQVDTSDPEGRESIAVLGFSLRLPQEATSPTAFWQMLQDRKCATTDWPKDRMNLDGFYNPQNGKRDTINLRGGHFLKDDLATFDAPFFNITLAEAQAMDPQQRILLELTYHALENAGLTMEQISGTKTGVFTGTMSDDYKRMSLHDPDDMPKYAAIGAPMNAVPNRISWFYNLQGPSVNVDTACSSSLYALDMACQSLRCGDSEMVIVIGSNLLLTPEAFVAYAALGFASKDSRCFSFDYRANGYARGEGFGVVILKPAADAIKDGYTIRAVIRSTASNSDGRTPGLAQPSRDAQARLIRDTYKKAGLSLGGTRYVEAHGTGTPTGDPIEAEAIGSCFGKYRSQTEPLYIGAVKSNIGHLEGGSGIAGLIKTVMVLEKGQIPPNANFEKLNPQIDAELWNIEFPMETLSWPGSGLRRASVNSFGYGGSNSHAVLDDADNFLRARGLGGHRRVNGIAKLAAMPTPPMSPQSFDVQKLDSKILVWSAADEGSLSLLTKAYGEFLSNKEDLDDHFLDDLAYTLACRRSMHAWRTFAVIEKPSNLHTIRKLLSSPVRTASHRSMAFVFSGQGAQYEKMGLALLAYHVFREALEQCNVEFRKLGNDWSLLDALKRNNPPIDEPQVAQPICTALQIALVDLLNSWNVISSAVVGHSSGEVAAAYAAGGLDISSACRLAYFRGILASKIAKECRESYTMMATNLTEAAASSYLSEMEAQFPGSKPPTIACFNSPGNITMSGTEVSLDVLKTRLEAEGRFARKLKTGVAYHSPQMQTIAEEYRVSIGDLQPGPKRQKPAVFFSSLRGHRVGKEVLATADYWVDNMLYPVRFSQACSEMMTKPDPSLPRSLGMPSQVHVHDLLEIGPHSTLQRPISDILKHVSREKDATYLPLLSRFDPFPSTTLTTIGNLFTKDYPISFPNITTSNPNNTSPPNLLTDLPNYPFNHSQRYWHESRPSKESRLRSHAPSEFLGPRVAGSNPLSPRWRKFFSRAETPWIADHVVDGKCVYPGAGMIVMVTEGARQMAVEKGGGGEVKAFELGDVVFSNTIPVDLVGEGMTEVELSMQWPREGGASARRRGKSSAEFRICVLRDDEGWNENCRGKVSVIWKGDGGEHGSVDVDREQEFADAALQERYRDAVSACENNVDVKQFYHHLDKNGTNLGPAFFVLKSIKWARDGRVVGDIGPFECAPSHDGGLRNIVHPIILDAAMQIQAAFVSSGSTISLGSGVPTCIRRLRISATMNFSSKDCSLKAFAQAGWKGLNMVQSDIIALQEDGQLAFSISGMESTRVVFPKKEASSATKRIVFKERLIPDITMLNQAQSQSLCTTDIPDPPEMRAFCDDLRFVRLFFIMDALSRLQQVDSSGFSEHMKRYHIWMEDQKYRFEEGTLPYCATSWKTHMQDADHVNKTLKRIEHQNAFGKVTLAIGRNLVALLQSQVDPLELLFHENLLEPYYHQLIEPRKCRDGLLRYIEAMAFKNPSLRIFEIGAGTGSMTDCVIDALTEQSGESNGAPMFSLFDYTDISESFFHAAQEKYASAQNRMRFSKLDIESDPTSQGFSENSYDLVIASSVLHATKSLDETLQHVRQLLKPGGKLVLLEPTEPGDLNLSFDFGILPGWWRSTDEERIMSPCVSTQRWSEYLLANGFSGNDVVLQDFDERSCHVMSGIVSTAVEQTRQSPEMPILLFRDPECEIQGQIAAELEQSWQTQRRGSYEIMDTDRLSSAKISATATVTFLREIARPFLYGIDAPAFASLKELISKASRLIWLTQQEDSDQVPKHGLLPGLKRTLRQENNKLRFITVEVRGERLSAVAYAEVVTKILAADDDTSDVQIRDDEYIVCDGVVNVSRVLCDAPTNDAVVARTEPHSNQRSLGSFLVPLKLAIETPGLLNSVHFIEDPEASSAELVADEIEIQIKAVGVNFRDVLILLGKYNDDTLGCECAGMVTKIGSQCNDGRIRLGDHVVAGTAGCLGTVVRCKAALAVKIPEGISAEEACALPIAGVTAYYSLVEIARLKRDESVLIHAAAGGTGQMAVQVAQMVGAVVIATVGTDEKRQLLKDTYGIADDHIFHSRDASFAQGISRITNGRGVDVVLNSVSGNLLVASWGSLAPFGRFVEIGKSDIVANADLPMATFAKNATFSAVATDMLARERPELFGRLLGEVMDMLSEKKLGLQSPLNVFPLSQAVDAFKQLQSGKNVGKTVLTVKEDDKIMTVTKTPHTSHLDPEASYVIAGGLGGLGRSMARWMISRGARCLLLLSRSGEARSPPASQLFLRELRNQGIRIEAPPVDLTCPTVLAETLTSLSHIPPIKGCIQATMVLRDSLFENMSHEAWSTTIASKVATTHTLHNTLPRNLDFFIMLSSLAANISPAGQANYAAGNTYLNAFAEHRNAQDERQKKKGKRKNPATALNLGWFSEIGVIAETATLARAKNVLGGAGHLSEAEFLALLDVYCGSDNDKGDTATTGLGKNAIYSTTPLCGDIDPSQVTVGPEKAFWINSPAFSVLKATIPEEAAEGSRGPVAQGGDSRTADLQQQLHQAKTLEQATDAVVGLLRYKLCDIFSLASAKEVDVDKSMVAYGVDSLIAVELKSFFAKVARAEVSIFDISGAKSVGSLAAAVAEKSSSWERGAEQASAIQ